MTISLEFLLKTWLAAMSRHLLTWLAVCCWSFPTASDGWLGGVNFGAMRHLLGPLYTFMSSCTGAPIYIEIRFLLERFKVVLPTNRA